MMNSNIYSKRALWFGHEPEPCCSDDVLKKEKTSANPIKREIINNLPNTGKIRKKNTHLKKSKKRKK